MRTTCRSDNPARTCRDCANSYGWHNESFHDGRLLMCKCKAHGEHEFLLDGKNNRCKEFVMKGKTVVV